MRQETCPTSIPSGWWDKFDGTSNLKSRKRQILGGQAQLSHLSLLLWPDRIVPLWAQFDENINLDFRAHTFELAYKIVNEDSFHVD